MHLLTARLPVWGLDKTLIYGTSEFKPEYTSYAPELAGAPNALSTRLVAAPLQMNWLLNRAKSETYIQNVSCCHWHLGHLQEPQPRTEGGHRSDLFATNLVIWFSIGLRKLTGFGTLSFTPTIVH